MSSAACRAIPAVVTSGYKPKGSFSTIGGVNTYITGNTASSRRGIVSVYDVFGVIDQTIQGADRLADTLDESVVLLPDFFAYFKGEPLNHSLFPVDTPEKQARISNFMTEDGPGGLQKNSSLLLALIGEASAKFPSVTCWGALGLCWGGKILALTSIEGTPFKATVQAHPGRLAKEDAEKIVIPHMVLASDGEPVDVVEAYKEILGKRGHVETYTGMPHGWMSARADFGKKEIVEGFERGYKQTAEFLAKYM